MGCLRTCMQVLPICLRDSSDATKFEDENFREEAIERLLDLEPWQSTGKFLSQVLNNVDCRLFELGRDEKGSKGFEIALTFVRLGLGPRDAFSRISLAARRIIGRTLRSRPFSVFGFSNSWTVTLLDRGRVKYLFFGTSGRARDDPENTGGFLRDRISDLRSPSEAKINGLSTSREQSTINGCGRCLSTTWRCKKIAPSGGNARQNGVTVAIPEFCRRKYVSPSRNVVFLSNPSENKVFLDQSFARGWGSARGGVETL